MVCVSQFDKHCSGDLLCSSQTVFLFFQKVSKNGSPFCLLTPRCRLIYKWWCSLQVSSHYRDPAAWSIGIKRRHCCDATSRHCGSACMEHSLPNPGFSLLASEQLPVQFRSGPPRAGSGPGVKTFSGSPARAEQLKIFTLDLYGCAKRNTCAAWYTNGTWSEKRKCLFLKIFWNLKRH